MAGAAEHLTFLEFRFATLFRLAMIPKQHLRRAEANIDAVCLKRRLPQVGSALSCLNCCEATAGWLDAQEGESALRNLRTRPDETAIVGRAAVSPLENCASGYEINRVWASQHDQPPTLRPGPVQTLA